MIKFEVTGFKKTNAFFEKLRHFQIQHILSKYGEIGVSELSKNTPKDTGKTASSWSYAIEFQNGNYSLIFSNSNVNKGVNIAIILQYGHGTRNGGYVEGIDYINPSMQPVFEKLSNDIREEVLKL